MSNIHSSNFCLIFPGETHILLSTSSIWYVGNTEFWILVSWRVALGPSALLGSSGNFVRSEHRPADPRLTACAATRPQMIAVHVAFWHHPSVLDGTGDEAHAINNLTHCFLQKFKPAQNATINYKTEFLDTASQKYDLWRQITKLDFIRI